jgi:LPPG:FO 2-phospho-L-lactate transferase
VSPIVGGAAIKEPAAKIMGELGLVVSAKSVAEHYRRLIAGFVVDEIDGPLRADIESTGVAVRVVPTVMRSPGDRLRLAQDCLSFAQDLITART